MGKFDRFCQSCGMPRAMDEKGGGTNADGSTNSVYCSHCYTNGKFNDKFTHSAQMVHFVKEHLKESGIGPLKRWFYTMHISKLNRWKK
ncbi:MAG: zinc ribbon domain-containing protein [Bacteroidales bacterium]|nr:zinc ribbon domain-containing protein [Bacteroidales bacterium]